MADALLRANMGASARDFLGTVVPAIRPLIGPGEIVPTEGAADHDLRSRLDILAGVDAFQMQDTQGRMRALASRVQWGANYRTFSIRYSRKGARDTEWGKRVAAYQQPSEGWLLPALTIQAYLDLPKPGGSLIQAAVIRTADLYGYALTHPPERRLRDNHTACDSRHLRCAQLAWYSWAELRAAGLRVGIAPCTDNRP